MKDKGIQFGEKELFTVVRAIIIANLLDSEWFILSGSPAKERIASMKSSFQDEGIFVKIFDQELYIKLWIKARADLTELVTKAKMLQETIHQEIYHLTGLRTGKIDVIIIGICSS